MKDSTTNKTLITYGPSGTGKTTFIQGIIKEECKKPGTTVQVAMVYATSYEKTIDEFYGFGKKMYFIKNNNEIKMTFKGIAKYDNK